MKTKGFKNKTEAKNWLRSEGITLHHRSKTIIEFIPSKLHKNLPHVGSASDIRGGY